jgi:hypothetical protein
MNYEDYAEKYKGHWAEKLQVADRVIATLRHKTDGSRNVHGAEVIVVENKAREKVIIGWWNDREYTIAYNELKKKKENVKCDMCGQEIKGKSYPVTDENHTVQKGVEQCEKCYKMQVGYA